MPSSRLLRFLLAAAVLGAAGTSHAREATPVDPVALSDELTRLRAKVKQLELNLQIAAREAELRRITGQQQAPAEPPPTYALRSIEGVGKNLVASLQSSAAGSDILEVRAGDTLPDGSAVESIRSNTLLLRTRLGAAITVRLARASDPGSTSPLAHGTPASVPPGVPLLPPSARPPAVMARPGSAAQAQTHTH